MISIVEKVDEDWLRLKLTNAVLSDIFSTMREQGFVPKRESYLHGWILWSELKGKHWWNRIFEERKSLISCLKIDIEIQKLEFTVENEAELRNARKLAGLFKEKGFSCLIKKQFDGELGCV